MQNDSVKFKKLLFLVFCFLFFVSFTPAWAAEEVKPCNGEGYLSADQCLAKLNDTQKAEFSSRSKLLPACTFYEGTPYSCPCGCRDISDLVKFLIIYGNFAIGGVGAFALLMFIYGGFVMLTAAGASEKVQKGKQAIVAAVIGIIIVFSAQLLVRFIIQDALQAQLKEPGKSLEVKPEKTPPTPQP